jgi:hypothetical protein
VQPEADELRASSEASVNLGMFFGVDAHQAVYEEEHEVR